MTEHKQEKETDQKSEESLTKEENQSKNESNNHKKENESLEKNTSDDKKEHTKNKEKKKTDKEIITELTETLQRLQAEFENYKKHIDKEKQEFVAFATASVIEELLPVLDSFDQALQHTQKEEFGKGMKMVHELLIKSLEKQGLKSIDALNKPFDPQFHDVMLKEQSDKPEDTIIQELQKGYLLNGKVLRHSKVKVSSN